MEEAKYILKFNDAILVPKNETFKHIFIRNGLLAYGILSTIVSLLLEDFSTSRTVIYIIIFLVYIKKTGGDELKECYVELSLFEDYLLLYYPEHYFSKKVIRREYYKMYYKDVKVSKHRTVSKSITFFGDTEWTFYSYNKNGELEKNQSYRKVLGGMIKFYTKLEPNIDFVKEIETNTPLKFIIEES